MKRITLCLVLLTACGGDSTSPLPEPIPFTLVGVWDLRTIDGVSLPVQGEQPQSRITNGKIEFLEIGQYTEAYDDEGTDHGTFFFRHGGTYSISGSTVTLRQMSGSNVVDATYTSTLLPDSTTLTVMKGDGRKWQYVR